MKVENILMKFPIQDVNSLRKQAAKALGVPECPESLTGWALSSFVFGKFLAVFPHLRMKPRYCCQFAGKPGQ